VIIEKLAGLWWLGSSVIGCDRVESILGVQGDKLKLTIQFDPEPGFLCVEFVKGNMLLIIDGQKTIVTTDLTDYLDVYREKVKVKKLWLRAEPV